MSGPVKFFSADLAEDDPLKNFDAAEIIWDFFKSHRRKPLRVIDA